MDNTIKIVKEEIRSYIAEWHRNNPTVEGYGYNEGEEYITSYHLTKDESDFVVVDINKIDPEAISDEQVANFFRDCMYHLHFYGKDGRNLVLFILNEELRESIAEKIGGYSHGDVEDIEDLFCVVLDDDN